MLTILIRKDLNMRKGKMAAQSAHAAMKLLLESLIKQDHVLFMNESIQNQLNQFLSRQDIKNSIKIEYVNSEEELEQVTKDMTPSSIIVDHGRTEFHGQKTPTCAAFGLFDHIDLNYELLPPAENTDDREIFSKQVFVFSKEKALSKENTCKMAVFTCLSIIFDHFKQHHFEVDLSIVNNFTNWINGAFAKISVSTKTDQQFDELKTQLEDQGFQLSTCVIDENQCLAIEPLTNQEIDPFTRSLSLL